MYSISEKFSCMRKEYRQKYKSKLKRLRKGKGLAGVSLLSQVMERQSRSEDMKPTRGKDHNSEETLAVECQISENLGHNVMEQLSPAVDVPPLEGLKVGCEGFIGLPETEDSVSRTTPEVDCEISEGMEFVSLIKSGVSKVDNGLEKGCEIDVVSVSPSVDVHVVTGRPKLSFSIDSILYGGQVSESQSAATHELKGATNHVSAFRSTNGTSGLSSLRRKSLMYVAVSKFNYSE